MLHHALQPSCNNPEDGGALKHNQPPLSTNKEPLPVSKPDQNHPVTPPCTERGAPPAEVSVRYRQQSRACWEDTAEEPKRVEQIFLT